MDQKLCRERKTGCYSDAYQKTYFWLTVSSVIVTGIFGVILKKLDTSNLVFSIISITTSFIAVVLTMLCSSYYALGYSANGIVLIVLWVLASVKNPEYIPVAINFIIFFI